jgi:hypothetical protein
MHRYLRTLGDPMHVVALVCCCPDKTCPGHHEKLVSEDLMLLAPPHWSVSWDLFAWMGHRRFGRHWSVPQIRDELWDRFRVRVSEDVVEDYTAQYEVMVAARESDMEGLRAAYQESADLVLSIDGLQPEKGHETLYVVRELNLGRLLFAEPLLSSACDEVRGLFERAHEIARRLDKPVRAWVSDKQAAFVSGVASVFPGVPHRYCQNHFLRDAAKATLEADSHAKVQMRRKVRGLRDIERKLLAEQRAAGAVPRTPAETTETPSPPAIDDDPAVPQATGADIATAQVPAAPATATWPPTATAAGAAAPSQGRDSTPAAGASEASPLGTVAAVGTAQDVVMDYCAVVRGILNDDQGGPLHPPGVRMAQALGEVLDSIGRARLEKKGDLLTGPSASSPRVLNAAQHSSPRR